MMMNNGPNIVEQYVFVCNIGCKNVQNCPESVLKFLCPEFLFWSGKPEFVLESKLLILAISNFRIMVEETEVEPRLQKCHDDPDVSLSMFS
jgi:hypothetical protein